ncbi:hypothetical protein D9R12_14595 [Pseudoxanthomonas spadix]|nr:hypothetical protein D9R12_14595 [Pseudoxanthomonas spadix]
MLGHFSSTLACSLLPPGEGAPKGRMRGRGEALMGFGSRRLRPEPSPQPLSRWERGLSRQRRAAYVVAGASNATWNCWNTGSTS